MVQMKAWMDILGVVADDYVCWGRKNSELTFSLFAGFSGSHSFSQQILLGCPNPSYALGPLDNSSYSLFIATILLWASSL